MNKKAVIGVVVLALLLSCGIIRKQKNKTCVCLLLDLSGSTQNMTVRKMYAEAAHKVVRALEPGDALIAGRITQMSLSEPEFCVQHVFKKFTPSINNPLYARAEKKAFLKRTQSDKDSLLRQIDATLFDFSKKIKRTEIMGAIRVASRVFRNYGLKNNILVILSDMIEESNYYNFKKENISRRRIEQIIQREKRLGRLPKLNGVKIYVAGANEEGRYANLRKLWKAYFEASGAHFKPENYGSILIRFHK